MTVARMGCVRSALNPADNSVARAQLSPMGRPSNPQPPSSRPEIGSISFECCNGRARLVLDGEFDLGSLDATERAIARVLEHIPDLVSITIDLGAVSFLDAATARVLEQLAMTIPTARLVPPRGTAKRVIQYCPTLQRIAAGD
jgi:hypothetical protein